MTKNTKWAIIIIVFAVMVSVLLVGYKKNQYNQKIDDYCVKLAVKTLNDSRIVFSFKTCKELVRSAGGVERFIDLAEQALEEDEK